MGWDRRGSAVTPGRVELSADTHTAVVAETRLYSRQGENVGSALQNTGLVFQVIREKECPVKISSFRRVARSLFI